jgi:hypothetical protein
MSDWRIPAAEAAVIFQLLKDSENGKIIPGRIAEYLSKVGSGRQEHQRQRGADGFLPG